MNKPLLSICIPTYNRAEYLKKSIESIICQPEFNSDEVEIVISDNCSTDKTEELCRNYENRYSNIHYFRNEVNIRDKNFPTVLSEANGVFRKLSNDTVLYNKSVIYNLLNIIRKNITKKPYVFFSGGKNNKSHLYNDVNKFVKKVSYNSTWIGGIGLWEEDIERLGRNFYEGFETKLWQVKIMFDVLKYKSCFYYDTESKFSVQEIPNKIIDYSVFEIFYHNYLDLCFHAVKNNVIEEKTYLFLEKDVVLSFFAKATALNKYAFNIDDDSQKLRNAIKSNWLKKIFNFKNCFFLCFYFIKFRIKNHS